MENSVDTNTIRSLIKEYGSDTLSYFHLQDGRKYFLSPTGKSFLSYKIVKNVALVGGDPIGPEEEIPLLIQSFMQYLLSWGLSPLFVASSEKYTTLLKDNRMKLAKIGEEAIVDLQLFNQQLLKKKVRRAVRHLESLGAEIFFFTPATLPQLIRVQIEEISQEWVNEKGGKEKGFSMTLKRLPDDRDVDCLYAVAVVDGQVLGYLCFVPCYGMQSVSLDHIRSRKDMSNGLHEFLIIKSAEYFQQNNIHKLSLNFATFSNIVSSTKTKLHLRRALASLLEKFYKCDSLRSFNNKFLPFWESRYIAFPSLKYLPQYCFALLAAER